LLNDSLPEQRTVVVRMKRKRQHVVAGDIKSVGVVITVQIALMGALGVADFPDLEKCIVHDSVPRVENTIIVASL